ncbi:translation initiation factor IF-2-like [Panicum virgatum]|uniref:translation initiation factor IF-2-like n=1 Tax=Panicum virgatum TaxID=38727 RepID=UPI0019D51BE7|nr:translation initiation factor IF-2-like [Panicum virgatum]
MATARAVLHARHGHLHRRGSPLFPLLRRPAEAAFGAPPSRCASCSSRLRSAAAMPAQATAAKPACPEQGRSRGEEEDEERGGASPPGGAVRAAPACASSQWRAAPWGRKWNDEQFRSEEEENLAASAMDPRRLAMTAASRASASHRGLTSRRGPRPPPAGAAPGRGEAQGGGGAAADSHRSPYSGGRERPAPRHGCPDRPRVAARRGCPEEVMRPATDEGGRGRGPATTREGGAEGNAPVRE